MSIKQVCLCDFIFEISRIVLWSSSSDFVMVWWIYYVEITSAYCRVVEEVDELAKVGNEVEKSDEAIKDTAGSP